MVMLVLKARRLTRGAYAMLVDPGAKDSSEYHWWAVQIREHFVLSSPWSWPSCQTAGVAGVHVSRCDSATIEGGYFACHVVCTTMAATHVIEHHQKFLAHM